jgi:hypothetical protein
MAQRKLTQREWDQANDLSDELMTVMVGKGTRDNNGAKKAYTERMGSGQRPQ